ncbi:uncharacterized protein LOC114358776 [Ostrinia furnacalis]|uniref:uncharacterized protein LOC114358776 n=1 Tax=Ostrinia furnacalis TaxID=93504 RepID=UPI00103E6E99|nr:uncharacterized protein LOC114358776 [Ostrinia furnacalis]
MSSPFPVVLTGRTLGDRHRQLNALVEEAFKQNLEFDSLKDARETSSLDRLFKIDLASKYRRVDYIIITLKDDDMLYVSRALKSRWLLEPKYTNIINPEYLQEVVFPEMLTTSVSKMKQWLHLHLRDPQRCQKFYEYFAAKKDDSAMSFLWHCSNEFILNEVENLLTKLTPHQLKLMAEKCPQVAKLYFDSLSCNRDLIKVYSKNESKYYNSLKCLLKTDPDLFLDITEKYFNIHSFKRLSSSATKFIMKNHKIRFMNKMELYTAFLLNVQTLAAYLDSGEIKVLITKLAEADYLNWFSYKNVEPLLKKLQRNDRVQFKKQIFVDKCIGQKIKHWPYEIPSTPLLDDSDKIISLDNTYDPGDYGLGSRSGSHFRYMLKKRKFGKWKNVKREGSLDKLYNRFRFQNFERTFHILRKEILATSNIQNRMQMLLVLVSKSGGRVDTVHELLKWLIFHHSNEVVTLRAAVVRSLVKRSAVWRVPDESWQLLLQFARGLGLDGSDSEADCVEGIHAVVLRNLLSSKENTPSVFVAYLRSFSSFTEYPLTTGEKYIVKQLLPKILLNASEAKLDHDTSAASDLILKILDVKQAHKLSADSFLDNILSTVKRLAGKDPAASKEPLLRLYNSHTARKHLIRENFELVQTEASFLNVLRHEPELITDQKIHKIAGTEFQLDGFLRKLAIFFNEEGGLSKRFVEIIDGAMKEKPRVSLARPLAILAGASLTQYIKYYDGKPRKSIEKRIACSLRANAHIARPKFDLDRFGWREAGVKAVANKITMCSDSAIPAAVENLLLWKRTEKLALKLGIRGGIEASAFSCVAKSRPTVALKVALQYIRNKTDCFDSRVWDSVKNLITTIDLSSHKYLQKTLSKVDAMPISLRAEYAMLVYEAFRKISFNKAMPILCHIENMLPVIEQEFIEKVINKELLSKKFKLDESDSVDNYYDMNTISMFVRINAKYLLLSTSEEEQKTKMEKMGKSFLETLKSLETENTKEIMTYLEEFINGLRYTRVYMDKSYVSCLPLLKDIARWMTESFPIHSYFGKNINITFNIILFNAIRKVMEYKPEVLSDPPKVTREGLQYIGKEFGKIIVENINMMKGELFASIVDLYWTALNLFINKFLEYISRPSFGMAVCRGIVEWGSDSSSYYLAQMLYEQYFSHTSGGENDDFIEKLIDDPETSFFINDSSLF